MLFFPDLVCVKLEGLRESSLFYGEAEVLKLQDWSQHDERQFRKARDYG